MLYIALVLFHTKSMKTSCGFMRGYVWDYFTVTSWSLRWLPDNLSVMTRLQEIVLHITHLKTTLCPF